MSDLEESHILAMTRGKEKQEATSCYSMLSRCCRMRLRLGFPTFPFSFLFHSGVAKGALRHPLRYYRMSTSVAKSTDTVVTLQTIISQLSKNLSKKGLEQLFKLIHLQGKCND